MKQWFCIFACGLSLVPAAAAGLPPAEICSPLHAGSLPAQARVQAMRAPIAAAIAALDNAKIELPSPSLASGNVSYLSITPNFAEQLDKVCVLGYFELERKDEVQAIPLLVEHVEVIQRPHPGDPNQAIASTRIYFRTPRIEEFANARDMRGTWRFWQRHQTVQLKIAAFHYDDGQRGEVYFGRKLALTVSNKSSSVLAALLFATAFYLIAAAAAPAPQLPGWRSACTRLLPWKISSGQASLSQLQMLVFTLIVATLLFYQWLRTGLLQDISSDLLYLIGISTVGAASTQITTSVKKTLETDSYAYAQQLGWFNAPPAGPARRPRAREMLMTEQRFDIYKFQMLVFTFVIAAYVIASGADQLGHLQISATLLALMGMSQGAYVGGHATADNLRPLQEQLQGMLSLQQRYQASNDAQIRAELQLRFRQAATQAATLFGSIYSRVLSPEMLELPLEAQAPSAPA
ncbi:hypothetical protein [Massilia sp. YIM B04103]|uniref:hypothetical protein n=1 Tax=Massilia sp. YIM B04103 TaxID=2963106 RepID=UPI00210EEA42|nr:hypothetical protein [Massilia sp. YIM B04103]